MNTSFKNNCSTTCALTEITESVRKSWDNGLYSCGIFLDLEKAFNTVNHKILLSKLEYYGLTGKAKDCSSSSFHNRQQFTAIDRQNSQLNNFFLLQLTPCKAEQPLQCRWRIKQSYVQIFEN